MRKKLSDERIAGLNEFIASLMGLHFTESRLSDLERGITRAAADFGFDDEALFADWLRSGPLSKEHIERLASHLTVGETYFFRDPAVFAALEQRILPALMEARRDSRRIRVWSAGCSTGEEAYSIAMALSRLVPGMEDWNVSVLATDINPASLKKASEGVYTEWSFRDTPDWLRQKYFRPAERGRWRIVPEIRKMVTFGYMNLAEDSYPSLLNGTNGVDIIFCRNVLMYFSDAGARRVVEGLSRCLVDDGWLLLSPAEALRSISGLFTPANVERAIFYRKAGRKQGRVSPAPAAAPRAPASSCAQAAGTRPAPKAPEAAKAGHRGPGRQVPAGRELAAEAGELFVQGRYREAAGLLETLSADGMDEPRMLLLARAYANMGRLEEASVWCERARSANTLSEAAYILLATIRLEQARVDEALENLRKAVYIDQDFVIAHFMLGKLLMERAVQPQARRHLETARMLLNRRGEDELVPESDGIMAGRLREIIETMMDRGAGA